MTIENVARKVGWTLLNATTSGLAGMAAGGLVKGVKNKRNGNDFTNEIENGAAYGLVFGLVASILPPASGHFASRTTMAVIGGLFGGANS